MSDHSGVGVGENPESALDCCSLTLHSGDCFHYNVADYLGNEERSKENGVRYNFDLHRSGRLDYAEAYDRPLLRALLVSQLKQIMFLAGQLGPGLQPCRPQQKTLAFLRTRGRFLGPSELV